MLGVEFYDKEGRFVLLSNTETPLIPYGKVLSSADYTLTLPKIPNPMCPVSGVHSSVCPSCGTKMFRIGRS